MSRLPIISALIAILLWDLLARQNEGSFLISGPTAIGLYLFENTGLMGRALAATVTSAAWGFLWGNLAAVVMAALVVVAPRSERTISALALLAFCLPLVATGPILRVLYGTGTGPQITLAALACYYTTYLALLVGLRAIPTSWSDLMRIYGRGRWTTLLWVRAMASVPYLTAGLQIAAPAAFLGAMIGEFTGAERGLGVLTLRAMRSLDVDATWALATVSATVAMLAYCLIGWAGRASGFAPPVLLSAGQGGARRTTFASQILQSGLIIGLVLAIWYGAMEAFDLNKFFAKRPGDIWTFLTTNAAAPATLFSALMETLVFTIPGYIAGLLLGAGLAAAIVLVPVLSVTVLPVAVALRSVPIITTAPLIVLALGRGAAGTVTIVAVMIFFPTLVACIQGLRQTPGQIIDLFDSYAAGRWRLLILARIPAMLPAFFATARMAVPAAVLAVTTTEWLATGKGIGALMALTATTSDYNMLWSCVAVLSLVAVAGYLLVEALETAVLTVYAKEQMQR